MTTTPTNSSVIPRLIAESFIVFTSISASNAAMIVVIKSIIDANFKLIAGFSFVALISSDASKRSLCVFS